MAPLDGFPRSRRDQIVEYGVEGLTPGGPKHETVFDVEP